MVVLRAEECVAAPLWHISFGWHAVLGYSAGAAHALVCMPVQGFIDQGFTIGDYTSFLDTPLEQVFLPRRCKLVWLPVGATLFVPTGWLVQPLYLDVAEKSPPWLRAWSLAVFSKTMAQAAGTDILRATKTPNEAHLVTQSLATPGERRDAVTQFMEEVLPKRGAEGILQSRARVCPQPHYGNLGALARGCGQFAPPCDVSLVYCSLTTEQTLSLISQRCTPQRLSSKCIFF